MAQPVALFLRQERLPPVEVTRHNRIQEVWTSLVLPLLDGIPVQVVTAAITRLAQQM